MSGSRKGLGFRDRENIDDYRDVPDWGSPSTGPKDPYGYGRPGGYHEARNSDNKHGQRPSPTWTKEQGDVLTDPRRIADLEKQVEYIAASGQSDDFEGDVGPWRGTPIYYRLVEAWKRGERRRREQSQQSPGGYRTGGRF